MRVEDPSRRVAKYEGLCRRFAASVVGLVADHDFDDLAQQYRIIAWKALTAYERAHPAGMTEYRFLVMCMKNREHDLRRRVRRPVDSIEDLGSQSRDRLLTTDAEELYAAVEEGPLQIPAELDRVEVEIVVRLYVGWSQADVARALSIEKNAMTRYMRSIRLKLAEFRPALEAPAAELEIARAA